MARIAARVVADKARDAASQGPKAKVNPEARVRAAGLKARVKHKAKANPRGRVEDRKGRGKAILKVKAVLPWHRMQAENRAPAIKTATALHALQPMCPDMFS
jgi:hypothetical protein